MPPIRGVGVHSEKNPLLVRWLVALSLAVLTVVLSFVG